MFDNGAKQNILIKGDNVTGRWKKLYNQELYELIPPQR
jgi:hypothetical protein